MKGDMYVILLQRKASQSFMWEHVV